MKDWIIFGTSPFIVNIKNYDFKTDIIKAGINLFSQCPVDYRFANDIGAIGYINRNNISGYRIFLRKKAQDAGLKVHADYWYNDSADIQHEWTGKLLSYFTSALPAINYAYLSGAKNIYLAGVDLTWEDGHYYDNKNPVSRFIELPAPKYNIESMPMKERHRLEAGYKTGKKSIYSNKVDFIANKIKEFQKKINVYRLNPAGNLPLSFLPYKDVQELYADSGKCAE